MNTILFLALTVLGSGSYQDSKVSTEYFNSFQAQYGLEYRGESHGVRVSCNSTYIVCFASDGIDILILESTKI